MSARRDLAGSRRSCSSPPRRRSRSRSRSSCPGTRSRTSRTARSSRPTSSALGVFTFVEAAILLVAVAVLFLVWARSQRRASTCPGGDGVAITLAGGWARAAARLAAVRQARHPGRGRDDGHPVGDLRRAAGRGGADRRGRARARGAPPEPPNPAADDVGWVHAPEPRARAPRRTGARATRPRSPRSCASGRRGRASRASRRSTLARADDAAATSDDRLPDPDDARTPTTRCDERRHASDATPTIARASGPRACSTIPRARRRPACRTTRRRRRPGASGARTTRRRCGSDARHAGVLDDDRPAWSAVNPKGLPPIGR